MTVDDEKTDHETLEGMTEEEVDELLQKLVEEDMKLTEWPPVDRYRAKPGTHMRHLAKAPARGLFSCHVTPRGRCSSMTRSQV